MLFFSGCRRTSPELDDISQSFGERYPEYVIRSITAGKCDGTQRTAEIEFDAPDNVKNRGRSSLVCDKQADGSWMIVSEKTTMWTK
jgi:hypothetical protein